MTSLSSKLSVRLARVLAATAATAALAFVSFCLQGCSTFGGREADEYGWDYDGPGYMGDDAPVAAPDEPAPAVAEAAEPAEAAPAEAGTEAADAAAAPAADEDDGIDISKLPNVIEASSENTGIFETEESPATASKFDPVISQGYRLRITVMVGDNNEVGPTEVMVSDREDILLPLVGRVQCGGLTLEGLHSRLASRFAEFFTDPEVFVSFTYSDDGISPYGQVLVQGRVHREGWVNIPPTRNLRLSHAIQRCGGFSSSALRRKVLVTRTDDEGNTQRIIVDFKAIGKNGELEKDIILEPNDVVYVDESNF